MTLLIEKYKYNTLDRTTDPVTGKRIYKTPDGDGLPSVTTIIDQTSDKSALIAWRKRVGDAEADFQTSFAANVGSCFHTHMENYIKGIPRPTGTSLVRKTAEVISESIIENGIPKIDEIWGLEAPLYYSGLYAGTADVVGVWQGDEAIMDFKNTKKPKKLQWLDGYFLQLTAYGMAHNKMYGTNIKKGVIMMVSKDQPYTGEYQEFVIDLDDWVDEWLNRLSQYYASH